MDMIATTLDNAVFLSRSDPMTFKVSGPSADQGAPRWFAVVHVPDDAQALYWAGRTAVAVGWPQEVHRFPHRVRL
jgi:hypothetical protein